MLSSVPASTTSHLLAYLRQTEHATETSAPLLLRPRIYSWGPPPLFCRERCDGWGLVHQQPVQTQLLDDLAELVEIHRLLNVTVRAQVVAVHHVLFFPRRGEDNHGDDFRVRAIFDRAQHCQTIDLGEFLILLDLKLPKVDGLTVLRAI